MLAQCGTEGTLPAALVDAHHIAGRPTRASASCARIDAVPGAAPKLLSEYPVRHVAALMLLVGCTTPDPWEPSPPVTPPGTQPEVFIAPKGSYDLTTTFDLSVDALVSSPSTLTKTLRAYAGSPGQTLLAATDTSALDGLPLALRGNLSTWIDESISPLARLSVLGIELGVSSSMNKFTLDSVLVFTNGIARHHLVSIDFTSSSQFSLGAEPGEDVEAMPAVSTYGNGLEIGDHSLAIGVGGYAWDAIDESLADTGGIRGTLGAATQCTIVALSVATKCVGNSCVGHAAELQQICERGLDEISATSRDEAAAFRLRTLHFKRGTAGMSDADKDEIAESLFGGNWTAEISAGGATVATDLRFD